MHARRAAAIQPIFIFMIAGVVVLALLALAVIWTRPKPTGSDSPPMRGGSHVSTGNADPAAPQSPSVLAPLSATTLRVTSGTSTLTFTLQPSIDRWTLTQGDSTTLAQTPAVRGALTLLRDALAAPSDPRSQPPTDEALAAFIRVTLEGPGGVRTLAIEPQALGGRTRVLSLLPIVGVHAGSADLAQLFAPRSLQAWTDASALPALTPALRELSITAPGIALRAARSESTQRWTLLEPANAPIEPSAMEQFVGVLRALQLKGATALTPELASQHGIDQSSGRQFATITLSSTLRASTGSTTEQAELLQRLLIGAPADASASTRWVCALTAASSVLTLSPTVGTLDAQAVLDFAKSPEALVARPVLRAASGDIASISLAVDAAAFTKLDVVPPHDDATRALRLLRASPDHRAALNASPSWVVPAPAADARVLAATGEQAALATALAALLTDTNPSSMRLLTSSTTLSELFDFSPTAPDAAPPDRKQAAQAIATFTARDLGGEALATGCMALTSSGPARVLVRVGRVLRVWDLEAAAATANGPAATVFTLLPREVTPEG